METQVQLFETAKTEVAPATGKSGHKTHLCSKITVSIKVGNSFVKSNSNVRRWLGVWMDTDLTNQEVSQQMHEES
jgi:hypothetical protein